MKLEHIARLKESVESAALVPNSFVEWIDDDETAHVVIGVVTRESENSPVASLSGGGFVVLKDVDPTDFRLVAPAVTDNCSMTVKGEIPNGSITIRPHAELNTLCEHPDSLLTVLVPCLPPDDLFSPRCSSHCVAPVDGKDFGKCPQCGRLVAYIYRRDVRMVYPAEGTKGVSKFD